MAINEYVQNEVKKVITNAEYAFPLNHAMASAWILANFKGDNLKIFDMRKTSALCDYSIMATAQNATQARAMIDEVSANLKAQGANIVSYEGYEGADWILLDTGDIMIHVFNGPARDVYDLDMIYAKNPQVKIPEDFYFGKPTTISSEKPDLKGYF
ncbi:ribosome silencing factor [Peredibacter sp. HCB2-198]|uniref:ribosome silencing factor n=1 Tax=Peredibacter sp. HCB2-198 TaxID=3383025 RepID=UPI0038B612C0